MTFQTTEYCEIVRAAHDTASKLLNRGVVAAPGAPSRYTVQVNTQGGQTAAVSWNGSLVTMSLPSLKPDTRLTRIEADRIVGYIAHECCHVLHSNWKVWRKAVKRGPEIARLTNAIEDVRIEAAEIAGGYLPNLKNVLSETLNAKHWEALASRKAQGAPPIGTASADISYVLCVLGRLANGYTVPCAAGLAAGVAPKFRPIVAYALKRIPKLANNAAALKLATEVAARLAALAPAERPGQPGQPGQPQPKPGQDGPSAGQPGQPGQDDQADDDQADDDQAGDDQTGDDQAGDDQADDDQADDDQAGDGPEGHDPEGDGPKGDGQQGGQEAATGQDGNPEGTDSGQDGKTAGGPSEASEKPDPDQDGGKSTPDNPSAGSGGGGTPDLTPIEPDAANLDNLIRDAMERTGDTGDHDNLSALNTFAGATRHVLPPARIGGAGHIARLRALTGKPAKLRNQVAAIIRSQERHGHERFRSVGRMDRRALARIGAGATNVYTRRTFVPGVDTAVVILIDGSGSMGSAMPLAHLMALHLAEAIEAARGKVCIAGFWGMHDKVTLAIAKGFNERFDPTRLASFGVQQSTPLSVSILAAADLLREVHADRKIVLVLTDGACDLGYAVVQGAVAMVNKRGVECAGIGLGCDVDYAFPIAARVDDPTQLATTGLATLVKAIERGRPA